MWAASVGFFNGVNCTLGLKWCVSSPSTNSTPAPVVPAPEPPKPTLKAAPSVQDQFSLDGRRFIMAPHQYSKASPTDLQKERNATWNVYGRPIHVDESDGLEVWIYRGFQMNFILEGGGWHREYEVDTESTTTAEVPGATRSDVEEVVR